MANHAWECLLRHRGYKEVWSRQIEKVGDQMPKDEHPDANTWEITLWGGITLSGIMENITFAVKERRFETTYDSDGTQRDHALPDTYDLKMGGGSLTSVTLDAKCMPISSLWALLHMVEEAFPNAVVDVINDGADTFLKMAETLARGDEVYIPSTVREDWLNMAREFVRNAQR